MTNTQCQITLKDYPGQWALVPFALCFLLPFYA
jgi:hypothetical protein